MKRIHNPLLFGISVLLGAVLLSGCGRDEQRNAETEPVISETAETVENWVQTWSVESAVLSEGNEAVSFQQEWEGAFLATINRKVREEIPEEVKEDPDFQNDGRYDVYESALFRVTENGKRNKIRRYRTMPAPENPGNLERYYSESRTRAFRVRQDGCIVALESSYEAWLTTQGTQTRDRYYVRLLKENGVELSCSEIEVEPGQGLVCSEAVLLGSETIAVPQGNEILFFGLDGRKQFSVETPFSIRELCRTHSGNLAVILEDNGIRWVSVIQLSTLSVAVPQRVPDGAHSFCTAAKEGELWFLRNSEVYRYDLDDGMASKETSLISLGINPTEVGAFFSDEAGRLCFLLHKRITDMEAVREVYLVAAPCRIPTERVLLHIGAEEMTDCLTEAILRFNRESEHAFIEAVDYRNIGSGMQADDLPEILVMDEAAYRYLLDSGSLANLTMLLENDPEYSEEELFSAVRRTLSDDGGALRRLAAAFRIETMACDRERIGGRSTLNFSELRSLLADMPANSLLYEPYYTSERLLGDLLAVNRVQFNETEELNTSLYAELLNFANLQPADYSYDSYARDSTSTESKIYNGRLLFMQAYLATLDELKWYDAFFASGASFVGWPTPESSASRLCYDECLGISASCKEEVQEAAWQFLRTLLADEYMREAYGFPVRRQVLEQLMDEDAANVAYRVDEKGRYETDKNGNRIEIARDSWYSSEWRRHFIYAITPAQQQKLVELIDHCA